MFNSEFASFDPVPPPPVLRPVAKQPLKEEFESESSSTPVLLYEIPKSDTSKRSIVLELESLLQSGKTSNYQDEATKKALEDWMRITHHVMDYQYVYDMNSYVKSVQEDERSRLDKQFNSINNDVMIKKHMYLMRQRDAHKLQSRVRILLHSMLFISAVAFLYANRAFFGAAGYVLITLCCFAFGVYLIMYLKLNSSRRYNDWDSLYFNDGLDVEAEGSSKNDVSTATCAGTGGVP